MSYLLAPPGAGSTRLRLALLLQQKERLARAADTAAALLRRSLGYGAEMAAWFRTIALKVSAVAIGAMTGLAHRVSATVRGGWWPPVVAALLTSGPVRERLRRLTASTVPYTALAAHQLHARATILRATVGTVGQQLGQAVAASFRSSARTFTQTYTRLTTALATRFRRAVRLRSVAPVVAFGLLFGAGSLTVPGVLLLATAALLRTALAPVVRRPASQADLMPTPSGADGGSDEGLGAAEIAAVYDAMLTLEATLPEIGAVVAAALTATSPEGRVKAAELVADCHRQVDRLRELEIEASKANKGRPGHSPGADLARDIDDLLDRVAPELADLDQQLTAPAPVKPAPANRAQRRAAAGSAAKRRKAVSSNGTSG